MQFIRMHNQQKIKMKSLSTLLTLIKSAVGILMISNIPVQKIVSAKKSKPNIIFIFTDQQSYDMLGCYGNKDIKTPNIDQFATQGVKSNHCISNSPISTPYRGMLLSGMHPLHNGAVHNDVQMMPGNGNYFGEVLRDNGYQTAYIGKWHLLGGDRYRPVPEGKLRYGFDHLFLSNNCTLVYDSLRSYFWNEKGEKQMYNDWEFFAQTDQAIDFIDKNAGPKNKPIAMFLSWHAPHNWEPEVKGQHMYSAPPEFEAMYDPSTIQQRKNAKDSPRLREYYRGHMAMISALDRDFGRILSKIAEKGIDENTIIVFTSDHGDMLQSHNLDHKGVPETESIRVPLIINYPKNKPRESNLLVGTLDLMPTILGLAGLPVPSSGHGQNLAKAIKWQNDNFVSSVPLFLFSGNWRGVYTRDFTYSFMVAERKAKDFNILYDHKNDPYQFNNQFNNEQYRQTKEELHKLTLEWMDKFNDKGLAYDSLIRKILRPEIAEIFRLPFQKRVDMRNFDVIVKGKPVDLQ